MNDFLRDSDGTLQIQSGDLVVGDATRQHQKDIILAHKGWNHFQPTMGVGLQSYLLDTDGVVTLTQAIRYELERDGQVVEKVEIQKNAIQIQAIYG